MVMAGLDCLGGDFNMVRNGQLDRTDNGRGLVGKSGGLECWEEIERLSALIDAGRTRWGLQRVYTHWVDGLGSRIDWMLTAEC